MERDLKGIRNFFLIIVLFVPTLFFGITSIINESADLNSNREELASLNSAIEQTDQIKLDLERQQNMLNNRDYVILLLESKYFYQYEESE